MKFNTLVLIATMLFMVNLGHSATTPTEKKSSINQEMIHDYNGLVEVSMNLSVQVNVAAVKYSLVESNVLLVFNQTLNTSEKLPEQWLTDYRKRSFYNYNKHTRYQSSRKTDPYFYIHKDPGWSNLS